jgi:glycosyltransferase involved in cell wall biosynthesis
MAGYDRALFIERETKLIAMRIGIDAQMLCGVVTGIERYASEMTHELFRLYPESEFFLYAPKALTFSMPTYANVAVRTARVNFRAGKTLWSQTQLPYWANKDRLDLFWGPTHRLPMFLSNKVARVVTIHDLVWKHAGETMPRINRLAERVLMPNAIRLADRIMADSHSTADAIAGEFHLAKERIRVVHLGTTLLPDPRSIDSLSILGIDQPYFLFVGTLEPRKNLRRLLEAFASLDGASRKQALLVIAGGKGWGNIDLASLIRSLGLGESVRLTGYVSNEQLSTLYAHARFLAMPSLYEGFGLPLVEAMSFGVPALTSACSSLPEVAGDAGILVDPFSVDSIASGLLQMLNDDALRNRLAARARLNASRFSWEKSAQTAMEIFLEAISERNAKRVSRRS